MTSRELFNAKDDQHRELIGARQGGGPSFKDKKPGSKKIYNAGYLFSLLMTMSIGTIQFGYSIGSWNTAQAPYTMYRGWQKDDATNYQTLIQSITTAGCAIGALFAGPFASYGRWKCILATNGLVLIGSLLVILAFRMETGTASNVILYTGRFFYGLACGSYSVFCPKYIAETAPVEIKGPAGFMSQINITFGILVPFLLGNAFDQTKEGPVEALLWTIFIVPIALVIL